jgi:hypothetical protein
MKLSLYQIEVEYMELAQQMIDNGGEANEELEAKLLITEQNLQTKGINYGFIIKQMDAECDIIDSEIKRLQGLKKSRTNSIERLKEGISQAMQLFGVEEIKMPTLKINFRKSESVEITDMDKIDRNFIKIVTTESADKTAIKEAIKAGNPVAGAELKQNKNLQIK